MTDDDKIIIKSIIICYYRLNFYYASNPTQSKKNTFVSLFFTKGMLQKYKPF